MNIKMFFLGDTSIIPRKEKKIIKDQVEDSIAKLYKEKKAINGLHKIKFIPRQDKFNIYSEIKHTKEDIDHLFPKKIINQTNYLLGKLEINKKNILYLIDVDELFWMGNEYLIWPSDEKKIVSITLI